jgi:hypothetical protein
MLEVGAQRFGPRRDAYFDSAEPPLIGWHKITLHDHGIYCSMLSIIIHVTL